MKPTAVTIALALLVPLSSFALPKDRMWQTGKVLDTEKNSYFAGLYGTGDQTGSVSVSGNKGTYSGSSTTTTTAKYRVYQNYVIESEKYVFLTEQRLRWIWSKPARLIVNGPVKFAVEKDKLYIIDEDGKEVETKIVKQILKPS